MEGSLSFMVSAVSSFFFDYAVENLENGEL